MTNAVHRTRENKTRHSDVDKLSRTILLSYLLIAVIGGAIGVGIGYLIWGIAL